MNDQIKKTAAIAAVLCHIQTEEESIRKAQAAAGVTDFAPPASPGLWIYSTNQSQMMMRNLIQMRFVPGLKG